MRMCHVRYIQGANIQYYLLLQNFFNLQIINYFFKTYRARTFN